MIIIFNVMYYIIILTNDYDYYNYNNNNHFNY